MFKNSVIFCALSGFAFAADFPTPFNSEKGAPMPAEEVAATMELPPGFKCQVFAAEPDVQQPIAMAWDAKGRLWVAENYTYAENPARWDTTLRDRIIILEDKDGDGKHDGRKVFWDQGSYLTSVEVGYGGAWILHNGTLSFIADKNGDDVPDGTPEVLLDGFNTKTIGHNIVNGLRWGPDGWLYGRHGITDTSAVGAPGTALEKRTKVNCAIWRFHPTRKVFEAVAHGGTNSWGHDWNADGELFMINTVIGHLWHVIPGAYYRRMFGTHLNPHVYETIEQTADHFHWDTGSEKWSDIRTGISNKTLELGGGHAHVGLLIYQGGVWPKEYHGAMLTCNLHGNRINMDRLVREGCGYTGKHAPDFMKAKDKWFRGIDLLTGPDGNVFVADWSDSGECHDNDGVHRTSGRIYKIVYGETKKARKDGIIVCEVSDKREPVAQLNDWGFRQVLTDLHSKRYVQFANNDSYWKGARSENSDERFRSLVALSAAQNLLPDDLMFTLSDQTEAIQTFGVRHLMQDWSSEDKQTSRQVYSPRSQVKVKGVAVVREDTVDDTMVATIKRHCADLPNLKGSQEQIFGEFLHLAKTAKSGLVRLHLASALQRLPLEARWPIATALAQHGEDANDRQQPLMIWYGIEPAVAADPMKGVQFIASAKIPTVRRLVARRIAEDIEKQPAAVDALVALARSEGFQPSADGKMPSLLGDILAGMAAGLDGFSSAKKPQGWDELVTRSEGFQPSADGKMPSLLDHAKTLSLVFGSGRASDELIAIVKNTDGDANARRNAFTGLTRSAKPELLPIVRGLINDKVLGTAARSALAAYDNPKIPKALLSPWPERSQEQQAATVATLVTRPSYAHALLDAVKSGQVPLALITPYQARAIRSLKDADLDTKLTAVWGELRDSPEAKKAELADWMTKLTPDRLAKGDASKGKTLFTAVCAACHKLYGEGGLIGPDLTGGDRHKLTYLLENIIDPSAIVPADYRMSVFKLKDGRTITGVIPAQTDRTITVQTPAEKLTIERSQIAEQQQLSMSLMPEGQLTALGEENTVNLLRYLMSEGPVRSSGQ